MDNQEAAPDGAGTANIAVRVARSVASIAFGLWLGIGFIPAIYQAIMWVFSIFQIQLGCTTLCVDPRSLNEMTFVLLYVGSVLVAAAYSDKVAKKEHREYLAERARNAEANARLDAAKAEARKNWPFN